MNARAITIGTLTAWLAMATIASGQDTPENAPTEEAPASDEKKVRPTTGAGRLPVEDPTIHVERNEDLEAQAKEREEKKEQDKEKAKAKPAKKAAAPKAEDTPKEQDSSEEDDAIDAEHAATGLPVEDPTIEGTP
jgi:midasin (ATPase involved in ribosome maturation)